MPTLSNTKEPATFDARRQALIVARKRGEKWAKLLKLAGMRLQLAREERDLSLRDLAERAKTDAGTVSRIERGELPEVSAGLIFDLCEAMSLDPAFVWWGKPSLQATAEATPPPSSAVKSSTKSR